MNEISATGLAPELARRIVSRSLAADSSIGDHLPTSRLAEEFGVSPSPIREALELLERLDVVESKPNHGYFLSAETSVLNEVLETLAHVDDEDYYLTIVADRLAGLLPEAFTESDLMRHYKMTRTQMQRMLLQIEKDGWIERKAGYGWAFQPVVTSQNAHAQSYYFRAAIEPSALMEPGFTIQQAAFDKARADQEALLASNPDDLNLARVFELGAAFHEMLMGCSDNPFYLEALKRQTKLRRLIERPKAIDAARVRDQCQEHLQILNFLEQGSQEDAANLLREHLQAALSVSNNKNCKPPFGEFHF